MAAELPKCCWDLHPRLYRLLFFCKTGRAQDPRTTKSRNPREDIAGFSILDGIEEMNIEGFAPVIINISPLNSVLPLLGLDPSLDPLGDPLARPQDLALSSK